MKNNILFLKKSSAFAILIIITVMTACGASSKINAWQDGIFVRSQNNPIIHSEMEGLEGELGKNINGPSVIAVPKWIANPLGKYYMYFADHHGKFIRLAYSNNPEGPWKIYKPGTLQISKTAADGHIASPDVLIDEDTKTIRMYFHGKLPKSTEQKTFLSTSKDGLNFEVSKVILGDSYFRVFKYKAEYYALISGTFAHSKDGIQPFEEGAKILPNIRHSALTVMGDKLVIFYSQKGDEPERILKCEVNLAESSYKNWKAGTPQEVLKPELAYEGVNLPIEKSVGGFAKTPVHELRDPAIFIDKKDVYLYYSVAGESGIAVAKLTKKSL